MNILCATNMPFAPEAFATLGSVTVKDGRSITAADVREADILAIRSTTKVNPALLDGSRVRFVGTATIGTDHLDIPYLESRGIPWCFSPGCNANSVAEYVCTALLTLARRHGFTLAGKTLGVIGVGNVGRRVVDKARALGLRVLLNDPPRARLEESSAFLPLAELLPQCDIVTLHVPLTRSGPDATLHLANAAFFAQLKPGTVFLNAARGPVTDTAALQAAMDRGTIGHAVIDTWEGEPAYRHELLPRVDLATPHIAGYSYDGRVNGTVMVYREACRVLNLSPSWSPDHILPAAPIPAMSLSATGRSEEDVLAEAVRRIYDIEADDARMRASCVPDPAARATAFDRLRKTYPERREFPHTQLTLRDAAPTLVAKAAGLGFTLHP